MLPFIRRIAIVCGIFAVALQSYAGAGGLIVWMTDYEAARQKAKATGKVLLVNIHMESCVPCKKLMSGTLSDPGLAAEISQHCIPLSLDFDHDRDVISQWPVQAFPTQLFIAPDGQVLSTIVGNVAVSTYRAGLQRALQSLGTPVAASAPAATPSPPAGSGQAPGVPQPGSRQDGDAMLATGMPVPAPVQNLPPAVGAGPAVVESQPGLPPATSKDLPVADTTRYDNEVRPCDMSMPLALNGYCPVSMVQQAELLPGNPEHCCVYRDKRYQFRSGREMSEFLTMPRKYLPLEDGYCVVTWAEDHRRQSGQIEYPALFGDYLFLFANDDARQKFLRDPERYVDDAGRAHRIPLQSYRGEADTVR